MRQIDSKDYVKAALLLACLETLIVGLITAANKSKESGVILGLSAPRLILVVILFGCAISLAYLGVYWGRNKKQISKLESLIQNKYYELVFFFFWVFVVLFVIQFEAIFAILFAKIKFIDIPNFFLVLQPSLILGALVFIQGSVAIYLEFRQQINKNRPNDQIFFVWLFQSVEDFLESRNLRSFWNQVRLFFTKQKFGFLVGLGMIVVWIGIALTRIGVEPDDRYWNVAGVPILPQQLILVGLWILFLSDLKPLFASANFPRLKKISQDRSLFIFLVGLIWISAIVVWNSQELRHTYFAPGPYPPNFERYPFSDASEFDIGSQYFLLGEGLYNGVTTDRPFLMMFFALLHWIGGQNYDSVVLVQIFFLALIPVFLFILGWKYHSTTAGIGMAVLGILKEKNAISAASEISLANPKVLMSEMLTGLLMIGLSVVVVIWLERQKKSGILPILAGGILGLAIGVRVNAIFLFPLVLLIIFLGYVEKKMDKARWVSASLGFVFAMIMILTPYSVENIKAGGEPFWMMKITQVFNRSYTSGSESNELAPKTQQKLIDPEIDVSSKMKSVASFSWKVAWKNLTQINSSENFLALTVRHLIHNEITTLLIYPIDYQIEPLDEYLDKPYWDDLTDWAGQLEPIEIFLLGINLLVLSMGIGYAASQWKVTGLVPLFIHLGYNLTNAGARTSGGRYIVPVDWVVHVYFVLGLISIYYVKRNWRSKHPDGNRDFSKPKFGLSSVYLLIGLLAVGSSFLLSGLIRPEHPLVTGRQSLRMIDRTDLRFRDSTNTYRDVKKFVKSDPGYLATGVVFYPRFFGIGEDFEKFDLGPRSENESMLYFRFLTDRGAKHVSVMLTDERIQPFPNGEFAFLIGCDRGSYIEGKIVLPMDNKSTDVLVSDNPELSCD